MAAAKNDLCCGREKDVERLAALDFVATTNCGGAGKWRAEYNQHFSGAHVAILPDNDWTGEDHARHVARELLSVAKTVRIMRLPDLPEKGDVSDWLGRAVTARETNRTGNHHARAHGGRAR